MNELERNFTYVQPIFVLQEEADHEDTVEAAALSSISAFKGETERWSEWLSSSHAKTVRRAKAKEFTKIMAEAEASGLQWDVKELPGGKALATEPMSYEEMPKAMRRAQVSGTDFPRHGKAERLRSVPPVMEPVLFVNASLGMSTGKEAAQVAHGYWASSLELGGIPSQVRRVDAGSFALLRSKARAVIVDNGLTEIPKATATVLVL